MKKIITVITLIIALLMILAACGQTAVKPNEENDSAPVSGTNASVQTDETGPDDPAAADPTQPAGSEKGVIVVYFSRTGHTKPIAEYIKDELNADIYEISAKIPYTADDIRYDADTRAYKEQHDPAARPEIDGELPDLSTYDTVYLGYPIWHGEAPKIVYTFLEGVDMSEKTVIPFCTSASSPVGSSADNLHPLAPDAIWREGTRFDIGTTKEEIADWLG